MIINKQIAQGVAKLSKHWLRHAFKRFGDKLIASHKTYAASRSIKKHLPFFIRLDALYQTPKNITPRSLVKTFRADGLRRNNAAVIYLIMEGVLPGISDADLQLYNEIAKQDATVDALNDIWYGSFLRKYHEHCLRLQQTSLDRGNTRPKPKTVTSWINSAKAFLNLANNEGVRAMSQIETHHLDHFIASFSGYRASVRRFIRYLNKNGKLFRKIEVDSTVRRNATNIIIPPVTFNKLKKRCLEPQTPAKEALIGLLMVFYAQSATRVVQLRMDQIGRNDQGQITIRFNRVDIEIAKDFEPILERWLIERKSLSVLTSTDDSEYLFPGRKAGTTASAASIQYYYERWGVTSEQIIATSLYEMYRSGLTHPNVPHEAFGLSKAMTGKYMEIFGVHYHDTMNHNYNNSSR